MNNQERETASRVEKDYMQHTLWKRIYSQEVMSPLRCRLSMRCLEKDVMTYVFKFRLEEALRSTSRCLHHYYLNGAQALREVLSVDTEEDQMNFNYLYLRFEADLEVYVEANMKVDIAIMCGSSWRQTIHDYIKQNDLSVTMLSHHHIEFIDEYQKEVKRQALEGGVHRYYPAGWRGEFSYAPFYAAEGLLSALGKDLAIKAFKAYDHNPIDFGGVGTGVRVNHFFKIIAIGRDLKNEHEQSVSHNKALAILNKNYSKKSVFCGYCKKKGHVFKNCRLREKN